MAGGAAEGERNYRYYHGGSDILAIRSRNTLEMAKNLVFLFAISRRRSRLERLDLSII